MKLISMHIPLRQKEYCENSDKKMTELYVEAFDKCYLNEKVLIKEKERLEKELAKINKEIEKKKEKTLTAAEIAYLLESKSSSRNEKSLIERHTGFVNQFKRYYTTLEDFRNLVKNMLNSL